MLKRLGLLLFGIISLGLINFSSAGSVNYNGTYNLVHQTANFYSSNYLFAIKLPPLDYSYSDNSIINVSCQLSNFSGLVSLFGNDGFNFNRYGYVVGSTVSSLTIQLLNSYSNFDFDFTLDTFKPQLTFQGQSLQPLYIGFSNKNNIAGLSCNSTDKCYLSYDYSCTFSGDSVLSVGGSSSCDYSEYESQIQTLSGSLSSCQSENSSLSTSLGTCGSSLNSCYSELGQCMNNGGGSSSGEVQWSSLYINDIQHLGQPLINIYIPEEIHWEYVSGTGEFVLDIEGYNVDADYISGIVDSQSTLPNQVDLNNLVQNVIPLFVPGLVIILFIYFIFTFIKKVF